MKKKIIKFIKAVAFNMLVRIVSRIALAMIVSLLTVYFG